MSERKGGGGEGGRERGERGERERGREREGRERGGEGERGGERGGGGERGRGGWVSDPRQSDSTVPTGVCGGVLQGVSGEAGPEGPQVGDSVFLSFTVCSSLSSTLSSNVPGLPSNVHFKPGWPSGMVPLRSRFEPRFAHGAFSRSSHNL